jgi:hypothetical protein
VDNGDFLEAAFLSDGQVFLRQYRVHAWPCPRDLRRWPNVLGEFVDGCPQFERRLAGTCPRNRRHRVVTVLARTPPILDRGCLSWRLASAFGSTRDTYAFCERPDRGYSLILQILHASQRDDICTTAFLNWWTTEISYLGEENLSRTLALTHSSGGQVPQGSNRVFCHSNGQPVHREPVSL